MGITVLSLFDGISCGQLALQRAGIKVDRYLASEVDKYAIKITQKNFPNTEQLGDVKNVWARNLPKIDLLIGGSPCQDLSIAKAGRKGLDGERSGLFWHYVRLLRTCKPKYFLLENVSSMSKDNKQKITEVLGVSPIMINSALVSAQQRKRLYWTNIPNITQPEDKGLVLADILENGLPCEEKAKALTASYCGAILSDTLKRKRKSMIFNPLIPIQTDKSDKTYTVKDKKVVIRETAYKIDLPDGQYITRKLTPIECERLQTLPDNYTQGISNTQRYKCIGNGWTADVIAHIFKNLRGLTDSDVVALWEDNNVSKN